MVRTTVETQLAKIRKQVEALQAKEKALKAKSNDKVIAQIVALVKKHSVTIAELTDALGKSKASSKVKAPKASKKATGKQVAKVAPKYRNPANPAETWTGRGRTPVWAQALKDAGTFDTALIVTE